MMFLQSNDKKPVPRPGQARFGSGKGELGNGYETTLTPTLSLREREKNPLYRLVSLPLRGRAREGVV
jgi:hypothetical protein